MASWADEVDEGPSSKDGANGTRNGQKGQTQVFQKPPALQGHKPSGRGGPETLYKLLEARDEFEMLNLPVPSWDELGSPIWGVSEDDIKAACKKSQLLAHPDKNVAHEELAARVFELVNKAVKTMTDLDMRETALKQYVEKARLEERANFVYVHPQEHLESDLENLVKQKKNKEDLTNKHFDVYSQKIHDKLAARAKRKKEERERKEAALRVSSSSDDDAAANTKKIKARRREKRGAF